MFEQTPLEIWTDKSHKALEDFLAPAKKMFQDWAMTNQLVGPVVTLCYEPCSIVELAAIVGAFQHKMLNSR